MNSFSTTAAVGEFATALSHDVRNALTSIKVDVERTVHRPMDEAQGSAVLQRVLNNVARLDSLVSGALRLARGKQDHRTGALSRRRPYPAELASTPIVWVYYVPITRGNIMKAVNVRQLKNNPSLALRQARRNPVVVMNRDQPEALLVHLDDDRLLSEPGVRLALATSLYRDESLSLGQASRVAGLSVVEFINHLSRLGIPVIRGSAASVRDDAKAIAEWRKGTSRPTRAR